MSDLLRPILLLLSFWLATAGIYSNAVAESSIALIADAQEHTRELYPLPSAQQEAQFKHLLTELRCLVCQNQDLADSHALLAKDLRDQVYAMVQAGKSDQEVITYLSDRYGDFILFKPPVKPVTYLLWLGPFLFLLLGGIIFMRTCQRSVKNA